VRTIECYRMDLMANVPSGFPSGYGTASGYGTPKSIKQLADGTFAIVGSDHEWPLTYSDIFCLKSNLIFPGINFTNRQINFPIQDEYGTDVAVMTDGLLICGYGQDGSDYGIHIIKTDATGNCLWAKFIPGIGNDSAYSIVDANGGGYILAGETWPNGASVNDAYIIKVDSAGNCLFAKTVGGAGHEYAMSIVKAHDGGYLIAGITDSYGIGNWYMAKIDENGNEVWHRNFGTGDAGVTSFDMGSCIAQTSDNGYVMCGNIGNDAYLIKTDINGN
jgi:hypothetical protein